MIERLDRYPDAFGQISEIFRWYRLIARERENEKILELRQKAIDPHGTDSKANEELGKLLIARAKDKGIEESEYEEWRKAELKRLLEKAET